MHDNFSKSRLLKNSILLYVRMLFTMWINFYTTRLVLSNLGVENMGVYGVVGGVVSIFAVFNSGITSTIQRFITYELGLSNGNVNKVFCTSTNILIIYSIIFFILLEIAGSWILCNKLNIPEESQNSAFWVLQISIVTCVINIISIPYNALIVAHEKMNAFAFISIIQVIITCISVYSLSFFQEQRLIIYSLYMAMIAILIRILYQIYCRINFNEATYHLVIEKDILKRMAKFAGVSSISGIFQMILHQGTVFVINWVFGVSLNAVYNISLQVKNSVLSFALNLFKAIQPQITKTYAESNYRIHKKIVYSGSKLEVYLIYFILIPSFFRMDYIMYLWLGDAVPDYTIEFAKCTILISLTYAAFEPIRAAVLATTNITKFMIIPDAFCLLTLPVAYFICKFTKNPSHMIACIIVFDILACALRTYLGTKVSVLSCQELFHQVFIPCVVVGITSSLICFLLNIIIGNGLIGLSILLIINSVMLSVFIITIGLNNYEKKIIHEFYKKVRYKYESKN